MSRLAGTAVLEAAAATATAAAVALLARLAVRPTVRLAGRVRPYAAVSRSRLGVVADPAAVTATPASAAARRWVVQLAGHLGRLVDGSADDLLLLRLRHAGLYQDLPAAERIAAYRLGQLATTATATALFGLLGAASGRGAGVAVVTAGLGLLYGASRQRAKVDAAIERRRARMRVELYTVNQLLAMCVRAGGGVVQAIQRVVGRGRGAVVGELAEVLAAHRGGRYLAEALEHAARTTPEPQAARTYRLLATGAELGSDLAEGLRALSDDVHGQRVEAIRRTATRRRAAMLVPIIGVLAPVMLLFVAAPLPSIVFGGR